MSKVEQDQQVYEFISEWIEARQRPPTRREIGAGTGVIPFRLEASINRLRGAGKLAEGSLIPAALIRLPG